MSSSAKRLGVLLLALGGAIALVGVLVYFGALSWFGRLPGDIRIEGEHTKVFVPITSMLVVSVVLTVVLWVVRRWL